MPSRVRKLRSRWTRMDRKAKRMFSVPMLRREERVWERGMSATRPQASMTGRLAADGPGGPRQESHEGREAYPHEHNPTVIWAGNPVMVFTRRPPATQHYSR